MKLLEEKLKALHIGEDLEFVLQLVDQKHMEEIANHYKMLLDFNEQEKQIEKKKARLMDLYLEQGIEKEEYDRLNKQIEEELSDVIYRRSNLDTDIGQFYQNLKDCIKITDFSHFLMNSSRFCQKKQLLKLLTSNFFVGGKME